MADDFEIVDPEPVIRKQPKIKSLADIVKDKKKKEKEKKSSKKDKKEKKKKLPKKKEPIKPKTPLEIAEEEEKKAQSRVMIAKFIE